MSTIMGYFNDMDDPRTGNARRHEFCDIMTISLLCVLCGGETAVDMADFASAKEDFLREFLELPHGPPCHDTFSRLFRLITPASFQKLLDKFRADFAQEHDVRSAIAVDGKEMRRAFDRAADKSGLNVVTALAHGARLSPGITRSSKGAARFRRCAS